MKTSAITRCLVLMIFFIGVGGWATTRAADNINASGFELEGDIHPNTSFNAEDWENLNCPGQTNTARVSVFAQEAKDTTLYTIGSKDILDLSELFWKDGSVPDKSDIIDAYAAQYLATDTDGNGTSDTILISGGDRFDNSGDMFIGSWFFQSAVSVGVVDGNNKFVDSFGNLAHRTQGDILVLSNYNRGGTVGTIQVLKWVAADADHPNPLPCPFPAGGKQTDTLFGGTLCLIPSDPSLALGFTNGPDIGAQAIGSGIAGGCGGDWPSYKAKGKPAGSIPVNDFFESGINLSALGFGGECFASFLLETRASSSVTAELKDFLLQNFAPCGILCNKDVTPAETCEFSDCAQTTRNTITYTNEVKNIAGGAALSAVTLKDDNATPSNTSDDFYICFPANADGSCRTQTASCSFPLGANETLTCTRTTSTPDVSTSTLIKNTETATVVNPPGVAGCSDDAEVTVNPNPAVEISAFACNAADAPSSFTLDACGTGGTGTLNYLWNTGDTSSSITKSVGGTYSVTVTDSKTCQACTTRKVGYCTDGTQSGSCP